MLFRWHIYRWLKTSTDFEYRFCCEVLKNRYVDVKNERKDSKNGLLSDGEDADKEFRGTKRGTIVVSCDVCESYSITKQKHYTTLIRTRMTNSDPENQTETQQQGDHQQRHIHVGDYDISIDEDKAPLVGVAASAIILLIAVEIGQGVKRHIKEYGIAFASIALILSVVSLLPNNEQMKQYSPQLNYFLFVWCFIGACIMTFGDGPFIETSNGYFASWGMVIFAAMAMGYANIPLNDNLRRATEGQNLLLGLGACAIVCIVACVPYFDEYKFKAQGEAIFAIIISIMTVLLVANFVYGKYKGNAAMLQYEFPTLGVFALMWVLAAAMTTFRGPFSTTGNGYFAMWAGAVLAVKAAIRAKGSAPVSTSVSESE